MSSSESRRDLKEYIKKIYKYKIELHAHTCPGSRCGEVPPDEVIKNCKNDGFYAVVISNHFNMDYCERFGNTADEFVENYLKDYYEAKKYGDKYGVKVILGCEIRFTENWNDYLLFGINEEDLKDFYNALELGFENFAKNVKKDGMMIIQAHPFRNGMELVDEKLLDGVETFNMHFHHNSRVASAVKYAVEKKIPITTAGSDYHNEDGDDMGAVLCKELPENSYDIVEILKKNDFVFEIGGDAIALP